MDALAFCMNHPRQDSIPGFASASPLHAALANSRECAEAFWLQPIVVVSRFPVRRHLRASRHSIEAEVAHERTSDSRGCARRHWRGALKGFPMRVFFSSIIALVLSFP